MRGLRALRRAQSVVGAARIGVGHSCGRGAGSGCLQQIFMARSI